MTTEEKLPIVCDNGTGFVKLGYAGQYFPEHTFPSMIGTPTIKYSEEYTDVELKQEITRSSTSGTMPSMKSSSARRVTTVFCLPRPL
eukprot:378385-Amorphochlora_amoeboformis.AAC.1